MEKEIYHSFCKIVGSDQVYETEPMSRHTTFRIGGAADYYLCPHSKEELAQVIHVCGENSLPFVIIGNGSNLLVSDSGYRGAVIQIYKNMSNVQTSGERVRAQAGALLSQISRKAADASLAGMEFASGIPGTLGGAVVMNAGAYGGEMKDIVEEVTVLDLQGEIRVLKAEELEMGYRTSVVKTAGYIVLEAVLKLTAGDQEEIKARMRELTEQRTTKQPLEYPSAGSTFKRPQGYFAGKLIMDAGLRGYRVGGAQVSEKHCGFVINTGEATAADVYQLMQDVRQKVREKFGVDLEPEVKMLGEF